MRQETNNEMDLLLRRLGRRQDVFAPDAGDHLDADELSAYAENALPVAARSRYTEHLADCSRCRELVVQLSASTAVVSATQTTKVVELSGWRKFLASLFSPMVLRYAAPALGLIIVAAIGVMVMRSNSPSGEYVSQVQDQRAAPQKVAASPESRNYIFSTPATPADTTANKEPQTKSVPQREAAGDLEKPAAVAEQPAPTPTPASQPVVAAAPPPAPAKVEATTEEAQRRSDDAKPKQQEAEVKVASSDVSKRNFEEGKKEVKRAEEPPASRGRTAKTKSAEDTAAAAPRGATTSSTGGFLAGADKADKAGKDSREVTRTVAGRHFRQQGGIWIDTAYDSSRDTMSVSRGSENYRSLIADEPAIKTIADTLGGEIIVVWKGRTYRIR